MFTEHRWRWEKLPQTLNLLEECRYSLHHRNPPPFLTTRVQRANPLTKSKVALISKNTTMVGLWFLKPRPRRNPGCSP